MEKRAVLFVIAVIFFFSPLNNIFAQRGSARTDTVQIRFASPLPRNSDWGRALDRLAADWERTTGSAVRVVVNHDGREGSEARMLSSLSSDAIQVALFTSAGISEICPPIMTLSIPFFIKNDDELDNVLNEIKPILERRVNNNYVIIAWSKGGWVYLFSKEPVLTPEDLRRQKLGTNEEFRDINHSFRTMGFQLVESDLLALGTRLANNMINAIYFMPAAIAPMQLHRHLGNMMNLPIAPFMGAIVMNRVTWNKLSHDHQQEILRVTQRVAEEFDAAMPRAEISAISSMDRSGLKINKPTQAQEEMWRTEMNNTLSSLLGTTFDNDLYQQINNVIQRTRSGQ